MIEVSKKYLPQMSSSFSDPRLKLIVGDGFKYMGLHQGEFDVIVTDSSDPIGELDPHCCAVTCYVCLLVNCLGICNVRILFCLRACLGDIWLCHI